MRNVRRRQLLASRSVQDTCEVLTAERSLGRGAERRGEEASETGTDFLVSRER